MNSLSVAQKWLTKILACSVASVLSTAAFATTYVVDVDGVGCFTFANTHTDIAVALGVARNDASAGPHTIYICDGAYSEAGSLNINNDNLIGLTMEGESESGVVITGAAADIFNVQRDSVTFRTFSTSAGRYAFETSATGTNFTLDRITIDATTNDALRLNASNVTLATVTITNVGTTTAHDAIMANATVDGTFTATNLTITNAGGYCARLRGGEPDALVSFTTTVFTNCGTQGFRSEAATDALTIDDITINGTGNNHCMFIQGGDVAANGNVSITNATLNDCGNGGTDSGLFLNVNNGAGGAIVDVSDITVNNSTGRGIYVNNQ